MDAFDIITSGVIPEDACLDSIVEIETILLHLRKLDKELNHLKSLKRYRVSAADRQIKAVESQYEQFKHLIQSTMQKLEPNQKTFKFPSVGKTTRRVSKSSWEIVDEDAFIQFLDREGRTEEAVKVEKSISVRQAKKIIDEYEGNVPGVQEVPARESLSIRFEDEVQIAQKQELKDSLDSLESLEV